ncbi:MAG TPA: di-heme oxidoredictase family protein, partial [Polyangiales bacterium]|nr:di-heme oxidoredictase family protein [Polyangiales bacterium]
MIAIVGACADDDAKPKVNELEGVKLVREDAGDRPLPKLDSEWTSRFNAGDGLFDLRYYEAQGLGPVYIRSSCASCHEKDARGPG